jgi:hypothetical protein
MPRDYHTLICQHDAIIHQGERENPSLIKANQMSMQDIITP